jgi:hypothetical protein
MNVLKSTAAIEIEIGAECAKCNSPLTITVKPLPLPMTFEPSLQMKVMVEPCRECIEEAKQAIYDRA